MPEITHLTTWVASLALLEEDSLVRHEASNVHLILGLYRQPVS